MRMICLRRSSRLLDLSGLCWNSYTLKSADGVDFASGSRISSAPAAVPRRWNAFVFTLLFFGGWPPPISPSSSSATPSLPPHAYRVEKVQCGRWLVRWQLLSFSQSQVVSPTQRATTTRAVTLVRLIP
jgi:hypothetical protein